MSSLNMTSVFHFLFESQLQARTVFQHLLQTLVQLLALLLAEVVLPVPDNALANERRLALFHGKLWIVFFTQTFLLPSLHLLELALVDRSVQSFLRRRNVQKGGHRSNTLLCVLCQGGGEERRTHSDVIKKEMMAVKVAQKMN